jgi:arylsulfatase A
VSDEAVFGCDFFPTICEVTKTPPPKDRVIDGTSLVPLFSGKPVKRKEPIYWRNNYFKMRLALMIGDWKLIGSDDRKTFELYNLKDDIAETTDVSAKYPERFARMKTMLIKKDKEVLAEGPDWWKQDRINDVKRAANRKNRKKKKLRGDL